MNGVSEDGWVLIWKYTVIKTEKYCQTTKTLTERSGHVYMLGVSLQKQNGEETGR